MLSNRFDRDNLNVASGQKFFVQGKEYILGGVLGDGAIGVVRRATERQTQKQVAVKFLAPESKYIIEGSLEDISARFKREGVRGVNLEHNHLVKILAYSGNENASSFIESNPSNPSNPFIVMEHIQGRTLEHFLQKRMKQTDSENNPHFNITPQTLFIAYAVINALRYLHKKKLVHRDVKPANIYLTKVDGEVIPTIVKLGDFGVVKWGDFKKSITTGSLTMTGHKGLGTLKYMSPEQATKPKEVDVRSDMFSLGITLFELFTDRILPTTHDVYRIVLQRAVRGNVISKLHELGFPILSDEYESLFMSIYNMLAVPPASRPSSQEMEGKLRYFLDRIDYSHLYLP